MELITILLLALFGLKFCGTTGAIRWMRKHGQAYMSDVKVYEPASKCEYYELFEKHSGGFFPFGLKDYKLRRFAENTRTYSDSEMRFQPLADTLYKVLYWFPLLSLIAYVYVALSAILLHKYHPDFFLINHSHCCLIFGLVLLILADNIMISVEAVHSFAILGSYAVNLHLYAIGSRALSPGETLLLELRVFMFQVFMAVGTGAVACYFTYICLSGYNLPAYAHNNWLMSLIECSYFSMTTFFTVGFGDITPANIPGQVIAMMIMFQSFSLVVFVFASLLASKQGPDQS